MADDEVEAATILEPFSSVIYLLFQSYLTYDSHLCKLANKFVQVLKFTFCNFTPRSRVQSPKLDIHNPYSFQFHNPVSKILTPSPNLTIHSLWYYDW